ncbi:MAG: SpoIIE family protein phosphatase [Candidatus Hydrogenedentales bacterium]
MAREPAKILVVDDEPDLEPLILQRFMEEIRRQKYTFLFAENGAEALKALERERNIQAVLTDLNMPVMDGLTLLSQLEGKDALLKAVVISAYGDMKNIRAAMNRGAFDFITKPIDFNDLRITIEKTLKEVRRSQDAMSARDSLLLLQHELDSANRIQQSLLPQVFPPFPDRNEFDIRARMLPAHNVGGDLYDFFLIDDKQLGFVIGDVCGKGMPAALYMAVVRTLVKAYGLSGLPPGECVKRVNVLLQSENESNLFVTLFYGVLHTTTGEVYYSNAGHDAPYHLRPDGSLTELERTGDLVAGVREKQEYHTYAVQLQPQDTLVLYTDGVTEAMNAQQKMYGSQRFEIALKRAAAQPLMTLVNGIYADVAEYVGNAPQHDDITVLALRYLGE